MAWSERCPRCEGNLYVVQYDDGPAVKCLQCAREWQVRQQTAKTTRRLRRPRKVAA